MIEMDDMRDAVDYMIDLSHYIESRTGLSYTDSINVATKVYSNYLLATRLEDWLSNIDDRLSELDATIQKINIKKNNTNGQD